MGYGIQFWESLAGAMHAMSSKTRLRSIECPKVYKECVEIHDYLDIAIRAL